MKLRELLKGCSIRAVAGDVDVDILGLAYDSREVFPGFVFCAIRGTRMDGNDFVPKAIVRGAVAVVSASPPIPSLRMPWIQVEDERAALAGMAGNFFKPGPVQNLPPTTRSFDSRWSRYVMVNSRARPWRSRRTASGPLA